MPPEKISHEFLEELTSVLKLTIQKIVDLSEKVNDLSAKVSMLEKNMNTMTVGVSQIYQSLVGFYALLEASANNTIMILQSVDVAPFFQHPEVKEKMDELLREYQQFSEGISRLSKVWKELFSPENRDRIPFLLGRFSEIMESQVTPHIKRFVQLKDEIWLGYLRWKKEVKNNK